DLLAGLPTLRALGREKGPEHRVEELGEDHRRTTMSALRVAFLSSMVLELFATLCVALVAVSIGLRLVYGGMLLEPGIIALILAPEVYLPLRKVGAQFHAAEDGVAAASKSFEVIDSEQAQPRTGERAAPTSNTTIELDDVSIRGRGVLAPNALSACCEPGKVTVLTGANGSGKSTALLAILGATDTDSGQVRINETPVAELDAVSWWAQIGWLPQRPVLVPGTVRENIELYGPVEGLEKYCAESGFDQVLEELPQGLDTVIGVDGTGLSLGQRQRLALTRVLASQRPVLLLDEPTAHLDTDAEAEVLRTFRSIAAQGRTVVIVGHRPTVLAAADVVVTVHSTANNVGTAVPGQPVQLGGR
ncbi:MAG: ATP-binding cassette domain-containing protein, partial [Rhodococcus sp.]|nr:ATP-binding cassette domain-containing protein [Rhodococcus sp. (in: high G+C Gram-positive bacteria)]